MDQVEYLVFEIFTDDILIFCCCCNRKGIDVVFIFVFPFVWNLQYL